MNADENKAIAVRFFQEQDRLRGGPADELCAPTYTAQIGGNPPMDLAGHKQFARMFYGAFPDLYHTIEEPIAETDTVAVRFTLHGTHTHGFMDIPATGKSIRVSAIAMLKFKDGKVVALHGQFDQLGMLQQLGVIPMPGQVA
jgi:predicted ester cyclase